MTNVKPTLRLDIAMSDARLVEICQTFQHLQCIHLDHRFVLNTPVLKEVSQRTAGAVFHEDIDLVSVNLYAEVGYYVGVVEDLKDGLLIPNLASHGGD